MRLLPIHGALFAMVDDEDFENLSKYKWYISGGKPGSLYVGKYKNKRSNSYLHREILNAKRGQVVDHIDGNPLNNQKNNLRICSQKQNLWNSKKAINTTSKFKGVFFDKSRNKWQSKIMRNGKNLFIGRFDHEIDAAKAYNEQALKSSGKFAFLNKI